MWLWRTMARSPADPLTPELPPSPMAPLGVADREEIECLVQVVSPQGEIGRRDRRREAVVERPGQAQRPVRVVPAEPQSQLVRPQLARVEEAEQLDPLEVRLAEGAELAVAVLAQVPRVV